MKLKNKYIIALALTGSVLIFFGFFRRIMHHAGADFMLKAGFGSLIVAVITFMVKMLFNKEKNHFLNK